MSELETIVSDTLALMALIERTEECGDCLLWTGSVGHSGLPIYKPYGKPCTLVRRAMFQLNGGTLIPRKPIDTRCGEKCCVNPAHLFQSTTSKVSQRAAKRGAFSGLVRRSKIAESKRSISKLTLEQARDIRVSPETGPVLALRYGVNKAVINGIKNGTRWKEYGGHWAGLMRMAA